jgi:hypothetical protein
MHKEVQESKSARVLFKVSLKIYDVITHAQVVCNKFKLYSQTIYNSNNKKQNE